METSGGDWEQKTNLINELTEGMELAKQLQMHLNVTTTTSSPPPPPPSSSSYETRELLVLRILNSYDKALSMLKWNGLVFGDQPQPSGVGAIGRSESPRSFSGSPHSDDSDLEFKAHDHKNGSKKRKSAVPRWTKQVQICPGTGLEGPLDDGFSWRKYGQKDILGAKYPRGYYRCTHRNVQGCLATKQVQRSDEDPTVFEITYRGRHTCTSAAASHLAPPPSSPEKQEPNTALNIQLAQHHHQQQHSLDFETGLRAMTEGLDTGNRLSVPSFYFGPTSHVKAEGSYIRSVHSAPDRNDFMGNFSPSFMSPATSGTNNFSVPPPSEMTSTFGRNQAFQGLESELTEIVSGGKSATLSPTEGLDFQFGGADQFEPTFSFDDNPGFF